jgi:hypothetical protein
VTKYVMLVARAYKGKIIVRTEIPVSDEADNYVVTIAVAPRASAHLQRPQTLDQLYGALEDAPLPEMTTDPLPEVHDVV